MKASYVQYGCGLCAPQGWRNFDASPTLRFQRLPLIGKFFHRPGYPAFPTNAEYGDIVRGLPLPIGQCRAVYCSHVLEHLALKDFRVAITNTYNLLDRDGIFRFVLPDLEQLAKDYVSSPDAKAALAFIRGSGLGREQRPRGFSALLRACWGNSSHLWMWDFKSLFLELKDVGFREIRRAQFGDASDIRFREVETAERWQTSVGVECMK